MAGSGTRASGDGPAPAVLAAPPKGPDGEAKPVKDATAAAKPAPPEQAPAPPVAAQANAKPLSKEDTSARDAGAAAADALVSELAGLSVAQPSLTQFSRRCITT